VRAQLQPLLELSNDEDSDDEIKGYALKAMWPASMSASSLFASLESPRRESLYGAYQSFLSSSFLNELASTDLPVALAWVHSRSGTQHREGHQLRRCEDAVLLRALEGAVDSAALAMVAEVLANRVAVFDEPLGRQAQGEFGVLMEVNSTLRRRLLLEIFNQFPPDRLMWAVWRGLRPIFGLDDAAWLVGVLANDGVEGATREIAWQLIHAVIQPGERSEHVLLAIVEAGARSDTMASEAQHIVGPIELESPIAEKLRKHHRLTTEYALDRDANRAESTPRPRLDRKARILDRIEAFEQGEIDAFWHAISWLCMEDDGICRLPDPGVSEAAGWAELDAADHARVLAAARDYVVRWADVTAPWSRGNERPWSAIAGYEALRLVHEFDEGGLEGLPADIWRKWAPFVVTTSRVGPNAFDQVHADLVLTAWQNAPEVAAQACEWRLRDEAVRLGRCDDTEVLELAWLMGGNRIARSLLVDEEVQAEPLAQVLAAAIRQADEGLVELAWRQLSSASPIAADRRASLGTVLLGTGGLDVVSRVLATVTRDPEVERRMLARLSARRGVGLLAGFTEGDLGQLLSAYWRHWPPSADPDLDGIGARSVTPDDEARAMRSYLVNAIVAHGSRAAVAELERCRAELPGGEYLDYAIHDARQRARSQTWLPPDASEVVALLIEQGTTLVRSPTDLIAALRKSLARLQSRLSGPTPAAEDLWNTARRNFQPKSELEISNYIARHLKEDLEEGGVVINREVEVRQSHGGARGERTDIHVQVARRGQRPGDTGIITGIVEVKPTWNRDLHTAMREQLVERYLRDEGGDAGLFLVPTFFCEQWVVTDQRRTKSQRAESADMQGKLAQQAIELTAEAGRPVEHVVLSCALR
jgi:hypothetical protein